MWAKLATVLIEDFVNDAEHATAKTGRKRARTQQYRVETITLRVVVLITTRSRIIQIKVTTLTV